MGRNGGALRTPTLTPSIVSGICTVEKTVQESLWNPKPSLSCSRPRRL